MTVEIMIYNGETLGVQLPNTVELEVTETEPGIKGDTASGGSKPATLETGLTVQVPFFINQGDVLVISTSNGKYGARSYKSCHTLRTNLCLTLEHIYLYRKLQTSCNAIFT